MEMQSRVTVGIRFHDLSRIQLLERCLFSVAAQTDVEIDICIAVQGVDRLGLRLIREVSKRALANSFNATLEVLDIPNPSRADLRSKLLNHIVGFHYRLPHSRFLIFIDYDDIWFSHALSTLVNSLTSGRFALAYADVHAADVVLTSHSFLVKGIRDVFQISTKSKADLRLGNFLPLHSYMFCTDYISRDLLEYDETLSRLEDYDVLLKIARSLPVVSSCRSCLIGLYNFYTDYRACSIGTLINTMCNPFLVDHDDLPLALVLEQSSLCCILSKNYGLEWKSFFGEDF